MKLVILLLLLGMILPVFAQESTLNNVSNQLENQINQDNLNSLEKRISDIENQPSFENQFISSEEYTKLMTRLYDLENERSNNYEIWLVIGTFIAVGVAFVGNYWAKNKLEEQNKITEKQNEISKQHIEYQGILEIMKIFNDDDNAKKRDEIYKRNRTNSLYAENGEFLGKDVEFFVTSIRGTFDNMGKLVSDGYVNKEQFLSMYFGSVIRMYKVLKRHIETERTKRRTNHFAVYFEQLYHDSIEYWKKHYPDSPEPEPY